MKLIYIFVIAMSVAMPSCSHKKTKKLIIHKVHIPIIKSKTKEMPTEKPKEKKVRPSCEREKEDDKWWFTTC